MHQIDRVDHTEASVQQMLRDYLAPHEPHALFILGNLRTNRPAELYVARRDDELVGVCGYYGTFKSLIPFSKDQQAVRELVAHVVGLHPEVTWVNGIDYVADPAREVMVSLGYQLANNPDQVFMELYGLPPEQAGEALCRKICDSDAAQTVRVLRGMDPTKDPDAPLTREEIDKVLLNRDRWVLVQDGRVVSTAATSGIGIRACQIIAVATDPAYRGRGFAQAVCAKLIRAMAKQGAEATVLFTGRENVAAQRCYAGLGFRITGGYCVAKFTSGT